MVDANLLDITGLWMRKEIEMKLADIMSEMDEEETETVEHAKRAVVSRDPR